MKKKTILTRRELIISGLTTIGGLMLPGCGKKLPPTYGNILRMGDNLTYVAHRALLPGQSMAKEYHQGDISSFPATGTTNPANKSNNITAKHGIVFTIMNLPTGAYLLKAGLRGQNHIRLQNYNVSHPGHRSLAIPVKKAGRPLRNGQECLLAKYWNTRVSSPLRDM